MSTNGEGVVGADFNVNPASLQEVSSNMSQAQKDFQAAVDAIDNAVMDIAGKAMGATSSDYQAFKQRYESQMKPKAAEISSQMKSHASKAAQTAANAEDTISANIKAIED